MPPVRKPYAARTVLIRSLIMKISLRLAGCAAGLVALALTGARAETDAFSIQFVSQFDYPGTGNQTRPQKISDKGAIAGVFVVSPGASFGFSLRGSTFSPPIKDPNDAGNLTEGRGINNAGTICGDYLDSAGGFEGVFFARYMCTQFAPGPQFSVLVGSNNLGKFLGS